MRLNVIERKSFHWLAYVAELRSLDHRAIVVPFIYYNALDEPHRCSPISTGAMNECGLIAWFCDRLEETIDHCRVRRSCVERKMDEINAGSLGGRRFAFDVGALFRR